ncbi:hypothetical protein [Desulforamulus aquiferis]|uniref:Uncharacterized protein n=1 Tax=Desulforamulus aquiferis TaxID=1397668 RepID=A0AAW7ZCU0_9FIRM|nr:hypothetical protein [Desulforamulus aquiferis]MDO7787216.1 hypothetical protein [Desulforamulus aquiferis]RYD02721.1 hypothetical protein N752_23360 [Desulforamulus aquiferis]
MRRLYFILLALGEAVCLLAGITFFLGLICFSGVKLLSMLGYYQSIYPYLPYLAGTVMLLVSLLCSVLLLLSWINGSTIGDYLDSRLFKGSEGGDTTSVRAR